MKSHGFTLVELMVVIGVVSLLATFVVVAYTKYQNDAYDSSTKNTATILKNAFENYYEKNQEYPSAYALRGDGLQDRTQPSASAYTSMATKLNVDVNVLTNSITNLIPVGTGGANVDASQAKDKIYYTTRTDNPIRLNGQASRVSECRYTVESVTDPSITSFLLIFWSYKDSKWLVAKSNNGPTGADPGCSFTTL